MIRVKKNQKKTQDTPTHVSLKKYGTMFIKKCFEFIRVLFKKEFLFFKRYRAPHEHLINLKKKLFTMERAHLYFRSLLQ